MPEPILDEARAGIDPDRLAVESLISDLHREREAAETASAEQRTAALEAERGRQRVTKELQSLEANRTRLIEKTQREMETELAQMRSRLRDATRELQQGARRSPACFTAAHADDSARTRFAWPDGGRSALAHRSEPRRGGPRGRARVADHPRQGDRDTTPRGAGDALEACAGAGTRGSATPW